jgi:enamine deaminase RidA (YjgF/YER057c/UK114 family)
MEVPLPQQTVRQSSGASSGHTVLLPEGWPRPRGYANGILARGETVFVGGMVGWDVDGRFPDGFVAQVKQTLENIVAVLEEGGARPEHIVRMTWYVVDMEEYRQAVPDLAPVYRAIMGSHYPAMALIEVKSLVERAARLEIEATAVIPPT